MSVGDLRLSVTSFVKAGRLQAGTAVRPPSLSVYSSEDIHRILRSGRDSPNSSVAQHMSAVPASNLSFRSLYDCTREVQIFSIVFYGRLCFSIIFINVTVSANPPMDSPLPTLSYNSPNSSPYSRIHLSLRDSSIIASGHISLI